MSVAMAFSRWNAVCALPDTSMISIRSTRQPGKAVVVVVLLEVEVVEGVVVSSVVTETD